MVQPRPETLSMEPIFKMAAEKKFVEVPLLFTEAGRVVGGPGSWKLELEGK